MLLSIQLQILAAAGRPRPRASRRRSGPRRRAGRADRERDLPRRPRRGGGGRRVGDHRQAELERRQGARADAGGPRRGRGDRGLVATVIVFPALLLSFWLVLQYAFVAHVRHVAQAAAQDASLAAAAGSGDPDAVAGQLMAESAGSMASGVQVASERRRRRGHRHRLRRRPPGVPDRRLPRIGLGVGPDRALRPPAGATVTRGPAARLGAGDSGPLEVVILLPAVLLLFGLVVAFGRTTTAATNVEHAAAVGARAAAAAQTVRRRRRPAAGGVVDDSLAGSGLSCAVPVDVAQRIVHARRPGHRHGDVRRRARRRHPVRVPARLADADGVGDRGHRPHPRGDGLMGARRLRGSRGSVSLLVVIMLPALLMAAGLVLDGGRQLQARRDAGAAAAAAARAATQLSEPELYGAGLDPRPRRRAGQRRARRPRARPGRSASTGSASRSTVDGGGRLPDPARWPVGLDVVDVDAARRRQHGGWRRERGPARRAGARRAPGDRRRGRRGAAGAAGRLVGNPWPGRARVEMRDEVAIVVGVLAVLAWLVWLRFVRRPRRRGAHPARRAAVGRPAGPDGPGRTRRARPVAHGRRPARPAAGGRDPDPPARSPAGSASAIAEARPRCGGERVESALVVGRGRHRVSPSPRRRPGAGGRPRPAR